MSTLWILDAPFGKRRDRLRSIAQCAAASIPEEKEGEGEGEGGRG